MSHRDALSIPLLVGSFTSNVWIPTLSQIESGIMWTMGIILIAVQIRYYWNNTDK